MRALVTGATGFVGRHLVAALRRQAEPPNVLSRNAESARTALGVPAFAWDPIASAPPAQSLLVGEAPVDVVFHLAGEPVAEGRWTAEKRRRILDSRVLGTRNLVDAIAAMQHKPRALISASATGFYGARDEELLDERAASGNDFLAEVCRAWEAEARRAESLGLRVAMLRIGIVLGEGGGALGRMETPFKLGLGGRLGDGQQWMPWIHVDDVIGLALHAATDQRIRGPLNVVAPAPARNRDFTRAYAAALRRPAVFPIPSFALHLAFGDLASVLLGSQHVVPQLALDTGYRFRHPTLDEALADATRKA